jgi:hypothetical protein
MHQAALGEMMQGDLQITHSGMQHPGHVPHGGQKTLLVRLSRQHGQLDHQPPQVIRQGSIRRVVQYAYIQFDPVSFQYIPLLFMHVILSETTLALHALAGRVSSSMMRFFALPGSE